MLGSSGYMLSRALKVKSLLKEEYDINIGIVDMWKIKPISSSTFQDTFKNYSHLVTLEKQTLSGGFGSAIGEISCDLNMGHKFLKLGLPEKYIFDNGTREELLNSNGLSVNEISTKTLNFYGK